MCEKMVMLMSTHQWPFLCIQCFIGCVVQNFATFGRLSMWLHLSGYNHGWVQQSSSPELAWLNLQFCERQQPVSCLHHTGPVHRTPTRVENTLVQKKIKFNLWNQFQKKEILVIDGNMLQISCINLSLLPDFPSPLGAAPCLLQSK